jgi:hypothetical protein
MVGISLIEIASSQPMDSILFRLEAQDFQISMSIMAGNIQLVLALTPSLGRSWLSAIVCNLHGDASVACKMIDGCA